MLNTQGTSWDTLSARESCHDCVQDNCSRMRNGHYLRNKVSPLPSKMETAYVSRSQWHDCMDAAVSGQRTQSEPRVCVDFWPVTAQAVVGRQRLTQIEARVGKKRAASYAPPYIVI